MKRRKRKIVCISALWLMIIIAISLEPAMAREVTFAGSTTVQKRVLEPAAGAIERATGITVTVRGINSGRGFAELREGTVKASIASSPLGLLLQKAGLPDNGTFREHVIVKDVIVPIVHPSNPLSTLTWQQLSDIHTGKITNWRDVGGPDQKIIVVTSQPTAATRVVFQKEVMQGAPYANGRREVKSTRQEVSLVGKFRGGIGAVSQGFVAMNPGKVKIIQTDEISRPLSIITKGNPDADVQAVIEFLKNPDAQRYFR